MQTFMSTYEKMFASEYGHTAEPAQKLYTNTCMYIAFSLWHNNMINLVLQFNTRKTKNEWRFRWVSGDAMLSALSNSWKENNMIN